MSDLHMNCEAFRDRVDAFLDGELGADEHAAMEAHATDCHSCAREMELARRIRDELHALPVFGAPTRVLEAAAREAAASKVVPLRARRVVRPRTLAAVAATLALVSLAVWSSLNQRASRAPEISDAEVRRATAEVALAFGYVDRYSDEAAGIVREDVFEKRVAPRIERAIAASRDAAIRDALVPGVKRAVRESGFNVTSPPPGRS
jgi:anti-sigma factor RsiW